MSSYLFYCRKSSESEERQVLSIDAQIVELTRLARNLQLRDFEVLTEARSAKSPGRPVFNAMMEKVSRGGVKAILCWKLDRLARNTKDGGEIVWALDRGDIQEIITPHTTYRNNSNDKFHMQLEFGMAKKYVDDLSDNVKRGNRAKLERGWLPGLAPLGYLNEPRERTIVKDQERFPVVRKMWDLLLQGTRPSAICKIANEEWGLKTRTFRKQEGGPLPLTTIYRIFSNPFYYGLIEREEGIFQGRQEPMITEEEYWKAQEILGRRGRPRPKGHHFSYTGLIRCGTCGFMITAEEKCNRYGSHYVYYRCTKKNRRVACREPHINLLNLEMQIGGQLERIFVPQPLLDIALNYLRQEEQEEEQQSLHIRKSLEKAFHDCERKLQNLNHMRLKDLINDDEYTKEKRLILEEKIRLEKGLENQSGYYKQARERTEKTLIYAHEAREKFENGTLEEKRTILQEFGSNLLLRDKKLIIEAEKPLIILEEGLSGFQSKNYPIEPQINGLNQSAIGHVDPVVRTGCTRREDVRTFSKKLGNSGRQKQLMKKLVRTIFEFYKSSLVKKDLPGMSDRDAV
ncbi:recombinase family protein [Candidatus Manganitrophus noduliformans]|uniref:Recombinase family protein n=1 Tax=Candidatus Manganitrophus noduliformans TaxID=2606439 RepID=A0A7X6DTY2_9BACT|nr:recombinase family protein [Candidatus Manganitrophus noduliformans]NKE72978.1 recombinase family protein [Candidatus Manganitrophus noduliformans]